MAERTASEEDGGISVLYRASKSTTRKEYSLKLPIASAKTCALNPCSQASLKMAGDPLIRTRMCEVPGFRYCRMWQDRRMEPSFVRSGTF